MSAAVPRARLRQSGFREIDPEGPYDDENTRVVLLGVNSMRGEGSDEDMYRIAAAQCRHAH